MKNSEMLLRHYQYCSDAHAHKGNLMFVPWSETNNDFIDSIKEENFINILKKEPAATTEEDYGQLVEVYNEEWVLNYLLSRGVSAKKIPEINIKTPDFECSMKINDETKKFFIELKSLNICDGVRGHNENNEESLNSAIEIEKEIEKTPNKKIYTSTYVPNNFSTKLDHNNQRSSLVDILIEKIENNLKENQFKNQPTFLFVMIDRLCPGVGRKEDLVSYFYDRDFSVASGILWTACFAHVGHLILKSSEFEGKSNIEKTLDRQGILVDKEYIAGIMFGCSFIKNEKKVFGLYDSTLTFKEANWSNLDTEEVFSKITHDYSDKKNEIIAWEVNKK